MELGRCPGQHAARARSGPITVGSYLSAIVREVERFEIVQYGQYETIHFWLTTGNKEKKLDFDAASMSDGTLRTAALTAAFQSVLPDGFPTFVGIEEPESALHPAATPALWTL